MKTKLTLLLIISLLLSISCIKETVEVDSEKISQWNRPLFVDAPIIKAKFSVADAISRVKSDFKQYILVNENGLVSAHYEDSIHSVWDDIAKTQDVAWEKEIEINGTPSDRSLSVNLEKKFLINQKPEQRFDRMLIESAQLVLDLDPSPDLEGNIKLSFPNLKKDNVLFQLEFPISGNKIHIEKDLNDSEIIFSQNSTKDSSCIDMKLEVQINQVNSSSASKINVKLNFKDLLPKVLFGYFGKEQVIHEDKSYNFDFFKDLKTVNMVEFKDINIQSHFNNYFGVPIEGQLKKVKLKHRETGEEKDLVFNLTGSNSNTVRVEPAQYSEDVEPKSNSILLNAQNSNIVDAINFSPDRVEYNIGVSINPDNDPSIPNFVTLTNQIQGKFYIDIPLWIRTKNYRRTDTIKPFNIFTKLQDNFIDILDSASLGLDFENRLPFDIKAQVYFANTKGLIIDSLFRDEQAILSSGEINSQGKVVTVGRTQVPISLTQAQVRKYRESKVDRMLIASQSRTGSGGAKFIKVFDDQSLMLKVFLSLKSSQIN